MPEYVVRVTAPDHSFGNIDLHKLEDVVYNYLVDNLNASVDNIDVHAEYN